MYIFGGLFVQKKRLEEQFFLYTVQTVYITERAKNRLAEMTSIVLCVEKKNSQVT